MTRSGLVMKNAEESIMVVNTITEAKAQFSAIIEKVLQGEEVIIKKAGNPAYRFPFVKLS